MQLNIEKIPSGGIRYVSDIWRIKENIQEENDLLKQKKKFFRDTYKKGKKYILRKDNSIVGFGVVYDGYIALLGIEPEYQGLGYGSKLLDEIKSEENKLFCHTRESNKKALEFYKSKDFEIDKRIVSYYCDGEDAYYLKYKK